ncbi:ZZ-type zinc finger-containing protein 3 isoform X2 [Entelurus aequoreus]|uniref:ZZ-type zinc finger-containing protein 3 isoform X2 n=1 Tax=Entelurus aequoreus TaxID=161455 RepID=UPI002B1E5934|nr:ZZ-type zinc finger-containing protein 3 isoform X2 [Entelurus aequoreus]
MAASRSSRVTRSSVGLNGLDENFCGRTLRNRSIAQPEETLVSPLPRARSPKKKQESRQVSKQESKRDDKQESKRDDKQSDKQQSKRDDKQESKRDDKQESKRDDKQSDKQQSKRDEKQESKRDDKQESKRDDKQESKRDDKQESKRDDKQESEQESKRDDKQESKRDDKQESKRDDKQESEQESKRDDKQEFKRDDKQSDKQRSKRDDKQESKRDDKQESKRDDKQSDKQQSKRDDKQESKRDDKQESEQESKRDSGQEPKRDDGQESKGDDKQNDKQESKRDDKQESKRDDRQESKRDDRQESKRDDRQESKKDDRQESKKDDRQESKRDDRQESKKDDRQESKRDDKQNDRQESKRDDRQESKRDDRQESKRDDRQESKKDDRQESKRDDKQNDRQESKRDDKQNDRQESKRDDRQESRQESRRDDRQESRRDDRRDDRQESKHKTKQDGKEDTDNDSKQGSQLQMSLQGMLNDSKDSNSSTASEQQPSAGSRKRSGSCLEQDNSLEKSEHCDKGKGVLDASPLIKRAKRCSRSVESQGRDEDAQKPASPGSNPDPHKGNSCDDIPDQNSNLAPAFPVFGEEEGELAVERSKEVRLKCDEVSQHTNSHKTSNGLGNNIAEETCTTPTSATSCPPLLNGSQGRAPPSPQPTVPCTSSSPVHMEVASSEDSFPPVQANPVDLLPELIVAKEQEVEDVEVDVVGDHMCLAGEEQVTESASDTNCCLLTPEPDAAASSPSSVADANCCSTYNSNSGETTPPLAPTPPLPPHDSGWHSSVPSTPPPFTELYEHRYTLRTSPRRNATGNKATSSKACSPPPPDNGPLKEEAAGALKDNCPVVEEHAPSDSVCTPTKELACTGPRDETCGEDGGPVEGKDVDAGKEATCGRTAEEDEEDDEEEPDVYYFESDHLALKHNKDYQRLLQTIGVLEAQRTQAILDLETLARHQREALTDPISFVEQLQKRVNLGLPCPQRVVQLPDVAWEQYTSGLGDFPREFCDKKRKTRRLKLIFDKGLPDRPRSPIEPKKEYDSSDMYSSLPTSDGPENGSQTQIIRGRICHPNKSDTFNQLWTVEEQKKLEQLLLKFPPEEVESKRWQKIADDLGNRTAKQVASRVQKYFIKLTKAGIPVPGRTPNLCMYTKKASSKRQHHLNKHLYRPSTFLTSYEPPVYMDDEDERSVYYSSMQDASADDSDEDGVPAELRNLPEYKELLELKRMKKRKIQEIHEDKAAVRHAGFKCDMCGMEPIQGVRWHCRDCPQDNSVDFCSNCSDCLLKTETHVPDHHLEAVYQTDTFLDRDYCLPQSTSYNYLDPNYFPANR